VGASPTSGFTQVHFLLRPENAYVRSPTGIGSRTGFTTHPVTARQWLDLAVEASFAWDRPCAQPMMETQRCQYYRCFSPSSCVLLCLA